LLPSNVAGIEADVASFPLLARGRDADVFDRGDGTVLRRYRTRDVPPHEVEVMRYVASHGYPVPTVVAVSGRDLILERIDGPEMQTRLEDGTLGIADAAAQLAELHGRLHELEAPPWLRELDGGDRVLHLDLHPRNVLLTAGGPVVIDWANAARGPAALDPAMAIAIFASVRASFPASARGPMDAFVRAFASHFDRAELEAAFALASRLRAGDRNVTDPERAALAAFRLEELQDPGEDR
jgi:Ser/Thr protein kinase RdoA (MazF antagonist)